MINDYMIILISHSGDLFLLGWGPSSSFVRRVLTPSSQELLGKSNANFVCRIYMAKKHGIVNFMTDYPKGGGGNFGVKSLKLMYFL